MDEANPEAAPAAPQTLDERVAYLEAQNEGLKRVGLLGLLLVLLLGGIIVYQTYGDLSSTTTRGLTLLNDKDQMSGAVTVDRQGRMLFLQASYGVMAAAGDLPADFRGFTFFDAEGRPRVLMGEDKDKHTIFMVNDPVRGLLFDPFEKVKPAVKPPVATPTPGAAPAIP